MIRLVLSLVLLASPSFLVADSSQTFKLTGGQTVIALETFRECDVCPEMIVMPSGSFMMGAIKGESRDPFDIYGEAATLRRRGPTEINIIPFEHPRHQVEMDIPFAIGRNEVTHAEWAVCVADGGCSHVPDRTNRTVMGTIETLGPDHPVFNVSFLDIQEYVAWLNARVGADVYRLPTEAEWEYAARAGTTTRFAQGDDLDSDQANFSRHATEFSSGKGYPHLTDLDIPVKVEERNAANGWGVRHMSGNVAEITLSCWSDRHLGLSSDSAYLADAIKQGTCERRVRKGGSFRSSMDNLRPAKRTRPTEDRRRDFQGFRLIRELSP